MGKSWTRSSSTSPSHGNDYNSELRLQIMDEGKNCSNILLCILKSWQPWPLEQRFHFVRFTLVLSSYEGVALEISSLAKTFQLALVLIQPGKVIITLDRMQELQLVIQMAR